MVCALAVGLAVGACDPGEEPTDPGTNGSDQTVTEPTTSETSESPSVEVPTPPELDQPDPPEAMGVDDRAGAAAAAEFFLRVLEYAQATNDVRLLASLSSPDCNFCQNQMESIEIRADSGQWVMAGASTLSDVRVQYSTDGEAGYIVRLALDVPVTTVMSAEGVVEEVPAGTYPNYAVVVEWVGDSFVIVGVDSDTAN